jgi:hypothetical protein
MNAYGMGSTNFSCALKPCACASARFLAGIFSLALISSMVDGYQQFGGKFCSNHQMP